MMSSRILMATVAVLALSAPAIAQDRLEPGDEEQEVNQQLDADEQILGDGEAPATDQPMAGEQLTAEEESVTEEQAPPEDMTFLEVQEEAQFLAADEVIGEDVVNVMDEEVGSIADLVMDQDQRLVGIVLSVGGFLGIGEKWVAVPVDEIRFPTDSEPARLLAAVTAEQLENAPDFVTRETVQARAAAEEAQRRMLEQQQQVPPPTTTIQ